MRLHFGLCLGVIHACQRFCPPIISDRPTEQNHCKPHTYASYLIKILPKNYSGISGVIMFASIHYDLRKNVDWLKWLIEIGTRAHSRMPQYQASLTLFDKNSANENHTARTLQTIATLVTNPQSSQLRKICRQKSLLVRLAARMLLVSVLVNSISVTSISCRRVYFFPNDWVVLFTNKLIISPTFFFYYIKLS